jgi:predicted Fe-Mo cluster-binding NifX family protein
MRRSGTFIFGEAVIEINPYVEVKDIRTDLLMLKEKIENTNEYIKHFTLLTAIPHPKNVRVAVPVINPAGLQSTVANTMEETTHYVFVDVKNDKISKHRIKKFDFRPSQFGRIVEYFQKEKANIIINNGMHSLIFYELRHLKHMQVYPNFSNVTNVENTVKLLVLDT